MAIVHSAALDWRKDWSSHPNRGRVDHWIGFQQSIRDSLEQLGDVLGKSMLHAV